MREVFADLGMFGVVRSGDCPMVLFDKGSVLETGGGRVVRKPFSVATLLDAIEGEEVFSFAGFSLYPATRRITGGSRSASLTEIESELLGLLWRSKSGIGSEALMKELFGRASPSAANALSTHIYNLRKKLSALGAKDSLISLVNGRYKLGS
ncbi:MAG: winged helix-turn-helix domain-containing protein [Rickettsiales bacterium]|nr:winged helix-turn-helix domain-containing protein [Rickettsiales bacterium]